LNLSPAQQRKIVAINGKKKRQQKIKTIRIRTCPEANEIGFQNAFARLIEKICNADAAWKAEFGNWRKMRLPPEHLKAAKGAVAALKKLIDAAKKLKPDSSKDD